MAERKDRRSPRGEREENPFDERVMAIDRVARVVKGGRRFRFRALVVVGDKKGSVGVGTAKGADVTAAISKATDVAKKNMIKTCHEEGTLPHEHQSKVSGAKILIKPASPGTGLIAGGVVRIILEVAGYQDILSKSLGSNNKINVAYATIEGLKAMKPRDQWHTTKLQKGSEKSKKADKKVASETKTAAKKPAAKKSSTAKKAGK